MEQTIFIAQFMGVFSIIAGVSMFLKKRMMLGVFDELKQNRALLYLMGVLELIGGLLLVLNHNIWQGGLLPVTVTVLSWFLLLEGIVYLFISKKEVAELVGFLHQKRVYMIIAIGYIVIGWYLVSSVY
jgi:hypothetical protein